MATVIAVHPIVASLMLHAQLGLWAMAVPVRLNDLSRVLHRSYLLIAPSTCMHMFESNLRVQVPTAVLERLLSRPCACHPSLPTTATTCSVPAISSQDSLCIDARPWTFQSLTRSSHSRRPVSGPSTPHVNVHCCFRANSLTRPLFDKTGCHR